MNAIFIEIAIEKAQTNEQCVALQGLRGVMAAYSVANMIFGHRISAGKVGDPETAELE